MKMTQRISKGWARAVDILWNGVSLERRREMARNINVELDRIEANIARIRAEAGSKK